MPRKILITVWSDYVCPFCYLEQPVLERISQTYGEAVEIVWRAFELRPAPTPTLDPDGEYLHTVWNRSVYPMARERGLTLRLPPVQPRSRRAMELAEFARDEGRYGAAHHALFRAFFEEGLDLDDLDVLLRIGATVGLEAESLRAALDDGRYTARVIDDERQAQELGIRAVPTMGIGRSGEALHRARFLSGAQPYETVAAAVEDAMRQELAEFPGRPQGHRS